VILWRLVVRRHVASIWNNDRKNTICEDRPTDCMVAALENVTGSGFVKKNRGLIESLSWEREFIQGVKYYPPSCA
jgi:hypothetical protein